MSAANCTAILLLIMALWPKIEGCYNKQRLGFCPRTRFVFQEMCPGVDPWPCNYVELRCGCDRGAARRSDGRCVLKEECGPRPEKRKPSNKTEVSKGTAEPKDEIKDPEVPDTPQVQETPVIKEEMYYSGGENGCPVDYTTCNTVCVNFGYQYGTCDTLLPRYCFCKRPQSTVQLPRPDLRKGSYRVGFPYGLLVSNGDLIQQLTDSHGCPEDETKCFAQCNRLGVEGAFCGPKSPHNCFCEGSLPSSIWKNSQNYEEMTDENGKFTTENQELCYLRCTTASYDGGFIPKNEESVCYCYKMFPRIKEFKNLLEAYAQKIEGLDLNQFAEKLIATQKRIVLALISTAAYRDDECHCMDSEFIRHKQQGAVLRTLSCYKSNDVKTTNVTLDVETKRSETRICITSESEDLPFGLQNSYKVLAGSSSCLLVQIKDTVREKPLCAIWGLDDASGHSDRSEEVCFDGMKKLCLEPVSFPVTRREDCGGS